MCTNCWFHLNTTRLNRITHYISLINECRHCIKSIAFDFVFAPCWTLKLTIGCIFLLWRLPTNRCPRFCWQMKLGSKFNWIFIIFSASCTLSPQVTYLDQQRFCYSDRPTGLVLGHCNFINRCVCRSTSNFRLKNEEHMNFVNPLHKQTSYCGDTRWPSYYVYSTLQFKYNERLFSILTLLDFADQQKTWFCRHQRCRK